MSHYQCIMIFERPHPQIDKDWKVGITKWREITLIAYRELKDATPLLCKTDSALMQAEPVDVLSDDMGLFVCCKQENGSYFARLLPGHD